MGTGARRRDLAAAASAIRVTTTNVNGLTFSMAPGFCPLDKTRRPQVILDGQKLEGPPVMSDRSWSAHFRKQGGQWAVTESVDDLSLHKQHGLQGPIDDAFMDAFIMVRPTGQPMNEKGGAWATAEWITRLTTGGGNFEGRRESRATRT